MLEHWRIKEPENSFQLILSKYKGYIQGNKNNIECIISKSQTKWHQVILEVIRKGENSAESRLPISAYFKSNICSAEELMDLCERVQVEILPREEAIIQKAIKEEEIQAELKAIARKLKGENRLDIYTDRSLANKGIRINSKKVMGIG